MLHFVLTGSGVPEERISVADSPDFSGARFMESYESKHSDHDFTRRLSDAVGITAPPLRLDSQAKYGAFPPSRHIILWYQTPAALDRPCTNARHLHRPNPLQNPGQSQVAHLRYTCCGPQGDQPTNQPRHHAGQRVSCNPLI